MSSSSRATHSAGVTWNPPPPVISPGMVVASTGDASRTQHERSTTRARWALPGTRLVQNALQYGMCVALTKDLVHDARERCGGVDDRTVLRKVFFRLMQAHSDFPFRWCSAPISGVECYSLINPPETGVQVDLKDK